MSGGTSELAESQQKLEQLQIEYDKAKDEWTGRLAAQQDEFQREKYDLIQDCSARLQAAKEDADVKNMEIVAELDKFRRAFAGDPLGWSAGTDEEGKPYYYNSETGESEYEKPRILEIAEVMQNIDSLDEGKKKQEKAIKKGKEAELQAKKLEVSLNGVRGEAAALRKTRKEWEECGTLITSLCAAMSDAMDKTDIRVAKVEERLPVVKRATEAVYIAEGKIRRLKEELSERDAKIGNMIEELAVAGVEVERSRDRADKLEERFTQAVEERVDEVKLPLEDELAASYAGCQEEKALREADRRYLADLWPEGWLVPSMLRRFRTMTPEERAQQTLKMEELEAERDLVEAIRAGVAAAAKWETKNDDYGRVFYANWESGEAVYEPPPEMGYRPPLGRNELGEKVDPRLQALREWEQGTDGWGKPFWQNSRTGDVVQIEPKGWSEAMGLAEHELGGWEGPTKGEVSKAVAVEAARVVVTWLNKAKEAEDERTRAAAERLEIHAGGGENVAEDSDEDDGDHDEFVYDIQSVEELAMGDEGWLYERSEVPIIGDGGNKSIANSPEKRDEETTDGHPTTMAEIRKIIVQLARREDRYEGRLKQVRQNLEDLAHDLLAAKRDEELDTHCFALGHGASVEERENIHQEDESKAEAAAAAPAPPAPPTPPAPPARGGRQRELLAEETGGSRKPGGSDAELLTLSSAAVEHRTTEPKADHASADGDFDDGDKTEETTTGGEKVTSAKGKATSSLRQDFAAITTEQFDPEQGPRANQDTTQAAGEAATEHAGGSVRGDEGGSSRGATKPATDGARDQQQELKTIEGQSLMSMHRSDLEYTTKHEDDGDAVQAEEAMGEEPLFTSSKTLPDSLAKEIGDRAFPLASSGEEEEDQKGGKRRVSCAAFHALAAEAVWAGFTGSDCVQKPLESVWDPRGGDRWGTAAFFAEQIGEREEEATPGLPRHANTSILQVYDENNNGDASHRGGGGGNAGGCSGGHPLSGSSARHATARTLCMAAVSSRRGFLKQAAEAAAKEAHQRSHNILQRVAASGTPSTEEEKAPAASKDGHTTANHSVVEQTKHASKKTRTSPITLGSGNSEFCCDESGEGKDVVVQGTRVSRGFRRPSRVHGGSDSNYENDAGMGGAEPMVVQSAVMLRFGVEVPTLAAAGKCGRTVQFSIPTNWSDPEAQEKQYAAQMARRKETIKTIRERDEAPLARPKGYAPQQAGTHEEESRRRGCQDARELLRYEAVVLEETLHFTLFEVKEIQAKLEEGRSQAAARWKGLISAEKTVLAGLAFDASRQNSAMAKMAMEIRGLRVPLIEPQPPPVPTLNPGQMKAPALVPDAEKMRQDEVDLLTVKIQGGNFDRGEPIILPEGKTLSSKQLQEITNVVDHRRTEVAILFEEETLRYNDAVGAFEYKHREWERLEVERKGRLSATCHQSRLDYLSLDSLAALTKSHKDHLDLLSLEASADESIALQSQNAKKRFEATLAREIAEETRAHEWLLRLQAELSDALEEKERLERLPDAALNRLDSLRWEKRRADRVIGCRRRVAEVRESLVEEGRRRRQLYDERTWVAQSELRRVLAERVSVGEKEGMLRLLLKVGDATLVARRATLGARKREAAEDKDGVGTEGTASPGEMYSADREWVSAAVREADDEQKAWEEKLGEMVQIRALARKRETTVGELVLGAARGALPPPHPDQWLPKADKQRHEDEVRLLLGRHERELRDGLEAVEASRLEAREAARDAAILKAKLRAIEGWRDLEIQTLRDAGRDAADSLKGLLEKQRKESAIRIDKLEQALSEIRKEYNEVRAELTGRIEQLSRGRSNTEAWVKALRHDLAQERAMRETAERRLAVVKGNAQVLSEKLRSELRAERMHSRRLELWIAALHDDIQCHIKAREELKRLHALEKFEHEQKLRAERHKVWRHRTSIRLLGTSVDNVFLFFAQRLANLAGSRRTHNDALRANGAVEVLAAICRGPRKDLRRLAARALGALGWNGHTEARVLAWDIYRHWDLWVRSCCPAEEARLRRRGRTFDDPEEFRHADQISTPLSPSLADIPQDRGSASPNDRPLSEESGQEVVQHHHHDQHQHQHHPSGDAGTSPQDDRGVSTSMSSEGPPPPPDPRNLHRDQDGTPALSLESSLPQGARGDGEPDLQQKKSLDKQPNHLVEEEKGKGVPANYEEDGEEDDFQPRAGTSARTVVRERRQWALRRTRRLEGPNEANQLELGGGLLAGDGGKGAWLNTAVARGAASGRVGAKGAARGRKELSVTGSNGEVEGNGGIVAMLTRLCQEWDDWEVVRAATAALSVAAYHEGNTDRMGMAAPKLISVLVGLLPHPDPEVQVHAATALANLAHASPSYQSEAGKMGAIDALLNVCCGRAGVSGGDGTAGGNGGGDGTTTGNIISAVDVDAVVQAAKQTDCGEQADRGGVEGRQPPSKTRPGAKEDLTIDRSEIKDTRSKEQQGNCPELEEGEPEPEDKNRTGDRWARTRGSEREQGASATGVAILSTEESCAPTIPTFPVRSTDNKSGSNDRGIQRANVGNGGTVHLLQRAEKTDAGKAGDETVEEVTTADTMDVDAVQAATAALANLLCYSESNSVRLVAAGGVGVLVGLVSSYRPHNLLDSDQVEEIQANAVEALVNATRHHGEEVATRIHSLGMSPLVLMCGSNNVQVQRHAALVVGNLCQTDTHRAIAGVEGGVEAMFVLCDADDFVVRANALWALGNLAWDPHNQERIGRYTSQLLSLVSSSWLPIRTNALICLANSLFFNEPNRRRVELVDGALLALLGYCGKDHPAPVQEAALRCLVSLTYVDRVVVPLVDAGCISTFVASLAPSEPATVRHPAALALLNVVVHDIHKSHVAEAGGVEAAVALLGSDDAEERELATRILAELACTEADDKKGGKKKQLDPPHLLGIVQMEGNLPAQKAAAEQIAHEISEDPRKQKDFGDCGGVTVLLGMCETKRHTEARILVPVLWGLRHCLHNNAVNKNRFVTAGGLEALIQLCDSSRSAGEWAVAEGALTTLVTATLGSETICRRLIRVGLDQLIDAAEDSCNSTSGNSYGRQQHTSISSEIAEGPVDSARQHQSKVAVGGAPSRSRSDRGGKSATKRPNELPVMPGVASTLRPTRSLPPIAASPPRGPATDGELGVDKIDEIGVDGVLQESADVLRLQMEGESRATCSALATSLLQALGPFNYVVCEHCGAREKGGTTCSQCGYGIKFDFSDEDEDLTSAPTRIDTMSGSRQAIAQGS